MKHHLRALGTVAWFISWIGGGFLVAAKYSDNAGAGFIWSYALTTCIYLAVYFTSKGSK